jgi:hypothetical protein
MIVDKMTVDKLDTEQMTVYRNYCSQNSNMSTD